LTKRGRRSVKSLQRRLAKKIVFRQAYHDQEIKEIINRTTPEWIMQVLNQVYGYVEVGAIPELEQGEVLVDSRGKGSFQKL